MLRAALRQAQHEVGEISARDCKRPANVRAWKRPMLTTVFRNAAWVVAWDEARATHVYRRDVDVAIRGNEIVFLGKDFTASPDLEIVRTRRLLFPRLVNIHTH